VIRADGVFIIPTRGRREQLEELLPNLHATRGGDTRLIVAIDDDDPAYDRGLSIPLPRNVGFVVGPHEPLTPKLNRWAVPAAQHYPVVGFLADDVDPGPGWDIAYYEALQTPGIAIPATFSRADGVGEHQAVSSVIIRGLGWYFQPRLRHYYTDNVWADLGRGAGCYRTSDAVIIHNHVLSGDETYRQAERHGPSDALAYREWRDGDGYITELATLKLILDAIGKETPS